MGEFRLLVTTRLRTIVNAILAVGQHSRFKLLFVGTFAASIIAGLFLLFFMMFRFLSNFEEFKLTLCNYLFSIFFLSLTVMLFFSTAVIAFTSIFRSSESTFLMSCPLSAGSIFGYKMLEAMVFSSWAFVLLGAPLIIAYGVTSAVPFYFYPAALLFFVSFSVIPAALGAAAALLVGTYFPSNRKVLFGGAAVACAAVGVRVILKLALAGKNQFGSLDHWASTILNKITFCQNPFLPSQWISNGILATSQRNLYEALFHFLLILSNAMLVALIAYVFAARKYRDGWSICQSASGAKRRANDGKLDAILHRALFFHSQPVRLLMIKDIKTFARDASQWSQVTIFVGLLAIYNLNLRNFSYDVAGPFWKNVVAFLNLSATALALSSFTGRFVFPMLSLEGRRFWILGLLPVQRREILMGKFFFAMSGSLLISEGLIILSDYMLRTGLSMMLLHIVVVVILCAGLSAIAVGFGAAFPNLREDNPSKIVAGLGGTLCLMLSLIFIAVIILLIALPCHAYAVWQMISLDTFKKWTTIAMASAVLIGIITTVGPMIMGIRRFERLEF